MFGSCVCTEHDGLFNLEIAVAFGHLGQVCALVGDGQVDGTDGEASGGPGHTTDAPGPAMGRQEVKGWRGPAAGVCHRGNAGAPQATEAIRVEVEPDVDSDSRHHDHDDVGQNARHILEDIARPFALSHRNVVNSHRLKRNIADARRV
eukprot:scaffold27848_cov149-Isochrysis_galbana.AAC.2